MTRTFSARPSLAMKALALLLWTAAAALLWHRWVLAGVPALMAALIVVERIVHTSYAVDGSQLVITRGRLSRPVTIALADITSANVKGTSLLKVVLRDGRQLTLRPTNPKALQLYLVQRDESV